jgi:putative nucleotidyltransferase with HDIG domain
MASTKGNGIETIADNLVTEVPKDFFFDGMQLPASIYLKMKPSNYLLIGKKGDKANFSNLHSFNHDNTKLFVRTSEHPALIAVVTALTAKVLDQKTVPDAVKLKFISGLTEDAMSSLTAAGFVSVVKVQKLCELMDTMSRNVSTFDKIIDILSHLPPGEAKHSMTTCMTAMLLCDEMQINLPMAREKVAMGSLLHDVGLRFVPKEILDKPKHLWSQDDLATYESHPLKGIEMLRDIKDIPSDVLLIVAEHHENAQGTGFPKKMRDIKVSPLAKIVSLANFFAGLVFNDKPDGKTYTPDEAIAYIDEMLGQPFNKQAFSALKNIINKKHLSDRTDT